MIIFNSLIAQENTVNFELSKAEKSFDHTQLPTQSMADHSVLNDAIDDFKNIILNKYFDKDEIEYHKLQEMKLAKSLGRAIKSETDARMRSYFNNNDKYSDDYHISYAYLKNHQNKSQKAPMSSEKGPRSNTAIVNSDVYYICAFPKDVVAKKAYFQKELEKLQKTFFDLTDDRKVKRNKRNERLDKWVASIAKARVYLGDVDPNSNPSTIELVEPLIEEAKRFFQKTALNDKEALGDETNKELATSFAGSSRESWEDLFTYWDVSKNYYYKKAFYYLSYIKNFQHEFCSQRGMDIRVISKITIVDQSIEGSDTLRQQVVEKVDSIVRVFYVNNEKLDSKVAPSLVDEFKSEARRSREERELLRLTNKDLIFESILNSTKVNIDQFL